MSYFNNYNVSFAASPALIPQKIKKVSPKSLKTTAVNKGGELFAKNETVEKSLKQKKKKRTIKAILLTIGTIAGLAIIGNKSSNYMAELGLKVDDALANKKWYKKFTESTGKFKQKFKDFFLNNKNKFIKDSANDIAETFGKKHAKPKMDMARGYGRGFTSIFSLR